MPSKAVALLLVCLASVCLAGACTSPRSEQAAVAAKPGWGRGFSHPERQFTVRAVPAALTPSVPITRLGKPGWGRTW